MLVAVVVATVAVVVSAAVAVVVIAAIAVVVIAAVVAAAVFISFVCVLSCQVSRRIWHYQIVR